MKKKIVTSFIVSFIVVVVGTAALVLRAYADDATTTPINANPSAMGASALQTQLQQKQQQIAALNQQITAQQANIKSIQSQRVTLQQQVNLINGNINTLNLGIQADTLTGQQLQLQIQQLNGDLGDISTSISTKQQAVASFLKEVQKNDVENANLLVVFLKGKSLADGVLEAQSLHNLQGQLTGDINTLTDLHNRYNGQVQQTSQKAQSVAANQADLQNKASLMQDEQQQKQTLLASTKNQESLFQKQLSALQQQQNQINSQIEAIDAVLRTKIDPSTLPALGAGVLNMPVQGDTQADITQGYGATAFAKTEYVHHWHNGIDLAAAIGTPLLAAADGTVNAEGNEDLYCPRGAYGKFVVINHNNGLTTLYGHMSKILVTAGEKVIRGQLIGYSGNTGDVTGPHLHFTVFAQSTYYLANSKSCGPLPQGGDLDPQGYLF